MREAAADHVRALCRKAAAAWAEDVTDTTLARSCLVVAPHPDDETLACGGTICRKTDAGTEVSVVFVTDGERSHNGVGMTPADLGRRRRKEAYLALGVLGVPPEHVHFLGFPDGAVRHHVPELAATLALLVASRRPEQILSPRFDEPHDDHAAVSVAVRQAVRDLAAPVDLVEYGIWLWSSWPLRAGAPRTRLARVSLNGLRRRKRDALEHYASQTTSLRGPGWVPLEDRFLNRFLEGYELFFPVPAAPRA